MKYQVGHLLYIAKEMKERYIGSYFHRFQEYSKTDYFLSFSKAKNERLFISLQSSHPMVDIVTHNASTFSALGTPLFLQLRKELDHAFLEDVEVWNQDRILALRLSCTNEIYQTHIRYLVIELITGNANLLFLDEDKTILALYRSTSFDANRPLLKGITYTLPTQNDTFKKEIEVLPYSLSSFFDLYEKEVEDKRRKDQYAIVIKTIKSQKKALMKKKKNQMMDYQNALGAEKYKMYGDLLFTYLYALKDTGNEVVIEDVTIPLDPLKSLKDNAVSYYKKYQKSKSALEHLTIQMKETDEDIAYFTLLEEQWNHASEKELQEMYIELVDNNYIKVKKGKVKKEKKAFEPYFTSYHQVKIGYGKNNLQNDYLTFHLSKKKGYFLHVKDHPGSHVVIFDEHPTKEVIEYAASIALYLGGFLDGDVIYTPLNEVMKTTKKGLVQLKKYQTLHISSLPKDFSL